MPPRMRPAGTTSAPLIGQWFDLMPGYPAFEDQRGLPIIDQMVAMAWFATGRASAMAGAKPRASARPTPGAYRDAAGALLHPTRTYELRLPGPIPAKDFWSVVVYDLWTRSMLSNGQPHPQPEHLLTRHPDRR